MLREMDAPELNKLLLEEVENEDEAYRETVLAIADEKVMETYLNDWIKAF